MIIIPKTSSRTIALAPRLFFGLVVLSLLLPYSSFDGRVIPAYAYAGQWATTQAMSTPRANHTLTLLNSAKVLAAGGITSGVATTTAELYDAVAGTWSATGAMANPRYNHTATLLNTGKVLVAGGLNNNVVTSTAELYDPVAGTWSLTGSLVISRANQTATLLNDGTVLIVGGTSNINASPLASAEIYYPITGTWALAAPLHYTRLGHTATLLQDGRVLITGGGNAFAEIYDPQTNTWTYTGAMASARWYHTATLLTSGKVFVAGGQNAQNNGIYLSTAEVYDPQTNAWSSATKITYPIAGHTASLLNNGKILIAGGGEPNRFPAKWTQLYDPQLNSWSFNAPMLTARTSFPTVVLANGNVLVAGGFINLITPSATAEIYNPAATTGSSTGPAGTWSAAAPMSINRVSHTATLLNNGKVLITGGLFSPNAYDSNCCIGYYGPQATAELYDYQTGTWSATGEMSFSRAQHTATLLNNGKVLVAGGYTNTAELYDPQTGSWSVTGSMSVTRTLHAATLLADGRVLITGGNDNTNSPLASAEIYDPQTGVWSPAGTMSSPYTDHTSTLLGNGKVLVVNGIGAMNSNLLTTTTSVDLYDPQQNSWTPTTPLPTGRDQFTSTLLNNGKVLITGGQGKFTIQRPGTIAELYDPDTATWTDVGGPGSFIYDHTATLLPDGRVLVAGGCCTGLATEAALFDPASNLWSVTNSLIAGRNTHSATLLPNGNVLITGGYGQIFLIATIKDSAELYNNSAPRPSFTFSPWFPGFQDTVVFSDTSTDNPTAWHWDFGDSTTSTSAKPSHLYASTGIYTVTMTITSTSGTSSVQYPVHIGPEASFIFSPATAPVNTTIVFTDTSTGSPTNIDWDFGDGTTAGNINNTSHSFSASGTYTVSHEAGNNYGWSITQQTIYIGSAPAANFSYTPATIVASQPVTYTDTSTNSPTSWQWNFGDGSAINTSQNPTHTFSSAGAYSVVLTATNPAGSSTITKTLISNLIVVKNNDDNLGDTGGTLSYDLLHAHAGDGISFSLVINNTIQLSNGPLLVGIGVTINGGCTNGVPGVIITDTGALSGKDGMILTGNDHLSGLQIGGFSGRALVVRGTGNRVSCLKVVH